MRKTFLILSLFLIAAICSAQSHASKVSITSQEFKDKIEVYARNSNPIPVSIELTFSMSGLESDPHDSQYKIIDSKGSPQLVTTLYKKPNKAWNYRYNMKVYLGDFYSPGHDTTFVYTLPFKEGTAHYLSQGYDGSFSHQEEMAIDFIMPTGTPIMAMRDGIVAEVVEHNDDGCPYRSCLKMANSILIYHLDGTFSRYSHLKVNGSIVNVGDQVQQGQHIGYSGNTGWSSEAHLHFSIFEVAERNEYYSIATKFLTEDGVRHLEEGKKYSR